MKKIIVSLLVIVLCLGVGFSFVQHKARRDSSELKENEASLLSSEIDITEKVPAKNPDAVMRDFGKLSMTDPYKTDEEKFREKDSVVILGKVLETNYLLEGSTVFTKSEVKITKVFKGDLKEGEIISVKELGGFVPSDVFSKAIGEEKYGAYSEPEEEKVTTLDVRAEGFKVMEKGEAVILFLVPAESDIKEFQRSYEPLRLWQGKLLFDEKCGAFFPYYPAWDLAKSNDEAQSGKVKIKGVGENPDGAFARAYTLEEFSDLAKSIK